MRGSIITISMSQEVTDDKPMVRSELPWRGTRGGFTPSWLAAPGPSLAQAAGSRQAGTLTAHVKNNVGSIEHIRLITAGAKK
jgi:hypothetical protein